MKNTDELNVVYATDDHYVMQAAVSMVSLFENHTDMRFHLFIISDHISRDHWERLLRIAEKYGHRMDVIEMPDVESRMGVTLSTNGWAKAAYCRLFLCELIPREIDKLFYIDPDTLVVGDISGLVEVIRSKEFEGCYLAACVNSKSYYKRLHGFKRNEVYYNSGVMLINLGLWREKNIQKVFCDEIRRRNGRSIDPDQSYINCVLMSRTMVLPAKFNVVSLYCSGYGEFLKKSGYRPEETYAETELEDAVKNPVIIHFEGGRENKPWYQGCRHGMKEEWFRYLRTTEWSSFIPDGTASGEKDHPLSIVKGLIVKKLIQSRFGAKLYVKYKYG
nr:glycosyltransferase family 8 protein [Lachnospiraceae bacterium]